MLTDDEKVLFNIASKYLHKQPAVFDVGAHKGAYSEYVLSRIPDANCILFEPNNELFAELNKKYNAFNILLGETKGVKIFYECLGEADELSSTYKREVFADVEHKEDTKKCYTVDAFCESINLDFIDFLKIDVEGAELDVLKGSIKMLREERIMFLQVEYGGTYPDAGITFIDVINFMEPYGYNIYELVKGFLQRITKANFVEDYRFTNFLISYHDLG
jgi:FkbM family methyltransferase